MNERPRNSENFESFAERQIREAQQSGQFDGLPGLGDPIPGIDEPLHDNWWIRDKLRRENIQALSPVLEARLETERLLEAVAHSAGPRSEGSIVQILLPSHVDEVFK